ncbi:putative calcium-binding protein CML25 [Wolffia australiana]
MRGIRSFFRRQKKEERSRSNPPPASVEDLPTSPKRSPREELEIVFAKFDSNGDGKISSSELAAVLERLGGQPPSEEDVARMMAEADRDGDGFINLEEFLEVNTVNVLPADALEDLRDAFSVFDLDRNGSISAEELARVYEKLGESASVAQCRRMIEGVDRDGDGLINFDEFKLMMSSGSGFGAPKGDL